MPRVIFNRWKHSCSIVLFFFIGFFFGLYHWPKLIGQPCQLSTLSKLSKTKFSSTFYEHFSYRTKQTCRNDTSNLFLTIVVLSSFERLFIYLPAIFETWILTTTNEIEVIIFLEEKSTYTEDLIKDQFFKLTKHVTSCIYIVKLKHVENEYPPQKKSFYAMKFIYLYYRQRTSWILRLDDNAYVHIQKLVQWLRSIDSQRLVYIGQGGTGRRNGPPIHLPSATYFCMGGSGIIISQATLNALGPYLDQCLRTELRTNHEDVEIGRCILTHINVSCTNAYDSKHFFYHHYGPNYNFGHDFTPSILSHAFIIHPIKNRTTFRQIYNYYNREKQNTLFSLKWKSSQNVVYHTFLSSMEFNIERDINYQLLDVRWKYYVEMTLKYYIERLQTEWNKRSINLTIVNSKFLFGYYRTIPKYGLELINEILLNVYKYSSNQSIIVRKRFHTRQPFLKNNLIDYREIRNIDSNENEFLLNLVVVASNKDNALLRFLGNYEREILNYTSRKQMFTLTILYFQKENPIKRAISQMYARYSLFIRLFIVNDTELAYNRGLGRHLASKYFTSNQILFFLDVDIIFTGQALINTRRLMIHQLSIPDCFVYFPIIYSVFSNMLIVDNSSIIDADKYHGLFSIYGFGNVAVRKSDLDRIGGWETNNREWGNEDVNLFQQFSNISSKCYIFRAVEPGLRHYYHKKMCSDIKDKKRKKICDDAEINLFGSQIHMTNYLLANKIVKNANCSYYF